MKAVLSFILIIFGFIAYSQEYKIIQTNEYASCADYDIYKKVELPEKITEALECPPWVDIQGNYLTILSGLEIIMYNFENQEVKSLFKIYDDIDGISAPEWSKDKTKIMFVIINQNLNHGYKEFARIIVLSFDDEYKIKDKEKFDRPVNFFCGSICTSMPGEDFYFIDNQTIEYKRHNEIEENPGKKEQIKLKD